MMPVFKEHMPHDSNGHIYVDNDLGIDVRADVAYVLGRNTGDIGQLCGDVDASGQLLAEPRINKWSAHKPVEFNAPRRLTDQDFAAIHYGLDAHERLGSYMQSDYSDFFWEYARPQTFYRLLDFDGYNHKAKAPDLYTYAYPIYINQASENGRFRITFYEDANEIPVLDEQYKATPQATAPTAALSEWIVVLLIYGGGTTHLYNTGKKLSEFAASDVIDYHTSIAGYQVGANVTIVPALVYPNDQMVVGDNLFTGSFLNNYYFVPLNFTEQMEHTYNRTIQFFHYLEGMSIGHDSMVRPHTGYNYYSFTSIGLVARKNNTGSNTVRFTLRLGVRRGSGSTEKKYYSQSQYTYDITTTSTAAPYVWYFPTNTSGTITFRPTFRETDVSTPISLQSGDVFFLEITERVGGETVTTDVGTQA